VEEELVRVEFRVPVWVHVDVANRQVVSVHVDDVSVEGPADVSAYSGAPVDEDLRQAAIALVSMDATWPAWTIGFEHG
jgi:hypothetical protein